MHPVTLLLNGTQYNAAHCRSYLTHSILTIANKIVLDMQQKTRSESPMTIMTSGEHSLDGQTNTETELGAFLVVLLKETGQLDLTSFTGILNRYQKIPSEEKKTIKAELNELVKKLNENPFGLTAKEIKLFEKYITLLFKTESPQRNYKKNNLLGENLTFYSHAKTKIQLPLDFLPLKTALGLVRTLGENLPAISERCYQDFFNQIKFDLESISVPCELIIVDDEWQEDPQVCAGIALRNKAHAERGGYAIIIEKNELDKLSFAQLRQLPLQNVYKISTLRHCSESTDDDVCSKITDLAQACCVKMPCNLREISIRQCFGAGRRPGFNEASTASSALDAGYANSPAIQVQINDILKHKKSYEADLIELKRSYTELQTRPTSNSSIESDSFIAKLVRKLQQSTILKESIPNLLVKGYYGAVAPYPESVNVSHMRPAMEQVSVERPYAPPRFFKATRVAPFVTQGTLPAHIARPRL